MGTMGPLIFRLTDVCSDSLACLHWTFLSHKTNGRIQFFFSWVDLITVSQSEVMFNYDYTVQV